MSEEASTKPPRLNLQDCRNQDFVSRLLAATPPYLYAAPTGPHSFFFSEMLRSLVQSKTNNDRNNLSGNNTITSSNPSNLNLPTQQIGQSNSSGGSSSSSSAGGLSSSIQSNINQTSSGICSSSSNNTIRRPRKRSWNHQKPSSFESVKKLSISNMIEEQQKEKPLELTINKPPPVSQSSSASAFSSPKLLSSTNENFSDNNNHTIQVSAPSSSITSTSSPMSLSRPSSELSLPPPPPMWYPPLYPPYGIDPLHFFIDLRVSGHIYDRKKDNMSPILRTPPSLLLNDSNNTNNNNNSNNNAPTYLDPDSLMKCRQNSAFSVPIPKDTHSAVNLSATSHEAAKKLIDEYDAKDAMIKSSNSTNYVMQNLPRIYTNLSPHTTSGGGGGCSSRNSPDAHCITSTDDKENLKERIKKFEINYKMENLDHGGGDDCKISHRQHILDGGHNDHDNNCNGEIDDDEPITIEEID